MKPRHIPRKQPRNITLSTLGNVVAGPRAVIETERVVNRAIAMRDDQAMLVSAQEKRERKAAKAAALVRRNNQKRKDCNGL